MNDKQRLIQQTARRIVENIRSGDLHVADLNDYQAALGVKADRSSLIRAAYATRGKERPAGMFPMLALTDVGQRETIAV